MAGESLISTGSIEKRAEELEVKQAEDQKKVDEAKAAEEKVAADKKAAEEAEKNGQVKDPVTGQFKKKEEVSKQPDDPKELRKWATKLSMENSEIRKQLETLAGMLTRKERSKVDWKELQKKSPEELQKIIEAREAELISEHKSTYEQNMAQSAAEITNYESNARFKDPENYPRWAELMPIMKALSDPNKPDTRVNFNQHPKKVLDELYELANEIADADPTWKKPAAKTPATPAGKSYSLEEVDALLAKAKEEAAAEHSKGLAAEAKGASVAGMGKGATKGKPGEVNKQALWDMPMDALKHTIQKATDDLHGR